VRYMAAVVHLTPQGSVVLDGPDMGEGDSGNFLVEGLAKLAGFMLDRPFEAWGAHVEKERRERGVYPPSEIYMATPEDQQQCFQGYYEDLARRAQAGQLRQGEAPPDSSGRISISGQFEVMYINGLICKVIFDHNPTNSFYVEESMPIDWMYPHETPFGIIMKINREPQAELSDDVFKLDHEFWTKYSARLCGNWITYDTTIEDITNFVERTYIRNNYKGYTGDHAFVRDDDAQKAFSKLRSSQAGVYAWRCGLPGTSPPCPQEYRQKTPEAQAALMRETEFAYKQAFAFCPYNGEVVFKYINFLLGMGQLEAETGHADQASRHFDNAVLVAETCQKLDPYNEQIRDIINNVKADKKEILDRLQAFGQIDAMEAMARTNQANVQNLMMLGGAYVQMQQTGRAVQLFDLALSRPELTFPEAQSMAVAFAQMQDMAHLDTALRKMVSLDTNSPEARCDLAALECLMGHQTESLADLKIAMDLNAKRLAKNPSANDLAKIVAHDQRFAAVQKMPEFQAMVNGH
jgi:tetratricopeptide (TPR) repeat protein